MTTDSLKRPSCVSRDPRVSQDTQACRDPRRNRDPRASRDPRANRKKSSLRQSNVTREEQHFRQHEFDQRLDYQSARHQLKRSQRPPGPRRATHGPVGSLRDDFTAGRHSRGHRPFSRAPFSIPDSRSGVRKNRQDRSDRIRHPVDPLPVTKMAHRRRSRNNGSHDRINSRANQETEQQWQHSRIESFNKSQNSGMAGRFKTRQHPIAQGRDRYGAQEVQNKDSKRDMAESQSNGQHQSGTPDIQSEDAKRECPKKLGSCESVHAIGVGEKSKKELGSQDKPSGVKTHERGGTNADSEQGRACKRSRTQPLSPEKCPAIEENNRKRPMRYYRPHEQSQPSSQQGSSHEAAGIAPWSGWGNKAGRWNTNGKHNPSSTNLESTRETDKHRLKQRLKQIDFGKNTIGYDNYARIVPKGRRRGHKLNEPPTPNRFIKRSKRAWAGLVRSWRRTLHKWDRCTDKPPPLDGSSVVAIDTAATVPQSKTQTERAAPPPKPILPSPEEAPQRHTDDRDTKITRPPSPVVEAIEEFDEFECDDLL